MSTYLKASERADLRGLRYDVQEALRRLDQHAARVAARTTPDPVLPWMRSCVANGEKGVAMFDLTFYDLTTGQRVASPSGECVRHAIQFLTIYAEATERAERRTPFSVHAQDSTTEIK